MKALVVDDDLALADVVSFTLRRAGYEVIVAHDGQMALDRWQSEQPDFIVLDLNLPKLSGLEVCQRIRAEADTPILILSVRDDDDDVVNGLKAGADDYIVKRSARASWWPASTRSCAELASAVPSRTSSVPVR